MENKNLIESIKEINNSLVFNEAEHTYKNKKTGQTYTSTTTILGNFEVMIKGAEHLKTMKHIYRASIMKGINDGLAEVIKPIEAYGAKTGIDYMDGKIYSFLDDAPEEMVKRIAFFEAASVGNEFHAKTEQYDLLGDGLESDREDVKVMFNNYKLFLEQYKPRTIATEIKLIHKNPAISIAGTFDGLAEINGKIVLLDKKTTKKVNRNKVFLQTSIYAVLLKSWGVNIDSLGIAWFNRDGKWEYIEEPFTKIWEMKANQIISVFGWATRDFKADK